MTHVSDGKLAEQAAANELVRLGYKIIDINWKTRRCEIDIIAQKNKAILFVEVKYRVSFNQGSGLEYITKSKYKQMLFAANLWIAQHNWNGDYQLAAIELSGPDFYVTNFLPEV